MAGNAADRPLRIGAFNVQKFGPTKRDNDEVMGFLTNIVRRYDIILIQEIVDINATEPDGTITQLMDKVNNNNNNGHVYDYVISGRLGTRCRDERGREQYAYLYRRGVVNVVDRYQHNEADETFMRPPYSVKFRKAGRNEETDFFLLGSHVQPGRQNVQRELEGLCTTAFDRAAEVFGTNRGVIMGDLNAGGSYLGRKKYSDLKRSWEHFTWLLDYNCETTVTRCTQKHSFDKFIVHDELMDSVVQGSAAVFNFKKKYRLNKCQAESVSNHFPIEFKLNLGAGQA